MNRRTLLIGGSSIVGVCLLAGGLWYFTRSTPDQGMPSIDMTAQKITVQTGDVIQKLSVVGTSKLANEQTFSFNQKEKITGVFVKVGDRVKVGTLLATLDMTKLDQEINTAKRAWEKEQATLDDLLDGKKPTEKMQIQLQLDTAIADLSRKQEDLDLLIRQKNDKMKEVEQDRSYADTSFALEKKKLDLLRSQTVLEMETLDRLNPTISIRFDQETDEYLSESREYLRIGQDYFDDIDKRVGVSANASHVLSFGDMYDQSIYIAAKVPVEWSQTKRATEKLGRTLRDFSGALAGIGSPASIEELLSLLTYQESVADALEDVGDLFARSTKESVVSSVLSQSDIDALVSLGNSIRSRGSADVIAFRKKKLSLMERPVVSQKEQESRIARIEKEKTLADTDLALSKLSFDRTKKIREIDERSLQITREVDDATRAVKTAQVTLSTVKEEWDETMKGYTDDEYDDAKRRVEDVRDRYDTVRKQADDYRLTATFDGTVRSVTMNVGDNLGETNDKKIVVEDRDAIMIEMTIDQLSISTIQQNQQIAASFSAFPGVIFSGYVSEIDTSPVDSSSQGGGGGGGGGLATYRVRATLYPFSAEYKIFGGMAVMVDIALQERRNVLVVPNLAIGRDDQGEYVTVVAADGSSEKRHIIGGEKNNELTEILSGLTVGDTIYDSQFGQEMIDTMGIMEEDPEDMMGGGMRGGY